MGCIFSKYARDQDECPEEIDVIEELESETTPQGASIEELTDETNAVFQYQKPPTSVRNGELKTIGRVFIYSFFIMMRASLFVKMCNS